MRQAYDHQVRKIWIANVHDPKVAGYQLELFMDMACNINSVSPSTLRDHYRRWLCRQFGEQAGRVLLDGMCDFYRLCGLRRPEFMGWTQTELDKRKYPRGLSPVDLSRGAHTLTITALDDHIVVDQWAIYPTKQRQQYALF